MLNKDEFDYLGITRWHDLGYKGQGVKIASKEDILIGIFDDINTIRYEENFSSSFSIHGTNVMDIIRQVCPEAIKIAAETKGNTKKRNFIQ